MSVKWNRKLGTSKREQGIQTPKAPQNCGYSKVKVFGKREKPSKAEVAKEFLDEKINAIAKLQ